MLLSGDLESAFENESCMAAPLECAMKIRGICDVLPKANGTVHVKVVLHWDFGLNFAV